MQFVRRHGELGLGSAMFTSHAITFNSNTVALSLLLNDQHSHLLHYFPHLLHHFSHLLHYFPNSCTTCTTSPTLAPLIPPLALLPPPLLQPLSNNPLRRHQASSLSLCSITTPSGLPSMLHQASSPISLLHHDAIRPPLPLRSRHPHCLRLWWSPSTIYCFLYWLYWWYSFYWTCFLCWKRSSLSLPCPRLSCPTLARSRAGMGC